MKKLYKLLLVAFITTNVTAQPQIGSIYENGIVYDLVFHPHHNILEIKIVQMQNHLYGNIIDVQNGSNQLVEDGWKVPIYGDFIQMAESRNLLNHNQHFVDFSIDHSYWTSDSGEEPGQTLGCTFGDINDLYPLSGAYIYTYANDQSGSAYLRFVQSIPIPWGDVLSSTEDTDNIEVCDDDVHINNNNINNFHHHIDLRLLQVCDFVDSCPLNFDSSASDTDDFYINSTISCGTTVAGNTSNSQNSYGNSSPEDIYQFEVTTSGTYEFSTCGSDYDTYLRIYDANMNQIDANDDACSIQSIVEMNLTEGTYYVLVEGYDLYSGVYILTIDCNFMNASTCLSGEVLDCDGSGECFSEGWINDGYCDGPEQMYGADLSCYDNDGGDCTESITSENDDYSITNFSNCLFGEVLDCDGSGECFSEGWINDGYCDGPEQMYGADLSCYDNDGGDCSITCENDDSSTDSYGDSCTGWYDANEYPGSYGCEGAYDSDEFNALEQCCICQGGQEGQRLTAPSESVKDGLCKISLDISLLFDSNKNLLTLMVNDLNEDKFLYYEMYDLLGKRLFKGQLQSVETVVPIASLSPGVYVLTVNTLNNETLKTLKFIKN